MGIIGGTSGELVKAAIAGGVSGLGGEQQPGALLQTAVAVHGDWDFP